ncbi:hypothetical protein ARMGADRAFT_932911 [Armillaria gallica]|uniref:Uncharacterized protein n=1 Tax=Armillaria gallica TaxID=47427 RepID=A0A2H3DUX8_ARMGA|nr:hypothetical protein ARMGADRAFT_932911 [Armillaria gallica]
MEGVKERECSFKLKDKGIIPDEARDIFCDLVALDNVPARQVVSAFKRIAEALGVPLEGDVSERSIDCIMKEGGNASKLQIVDAVLGVTISGDGTTHKNNNYESHCATVIDPENRKKQFFLSIKMAVNHTSQTQLDGWIELIEELYELFRESEFCTGEADAQDFWTTVTGMHTDHAEDQKKLFRLLKEWKQHCDREKRGEHTVLGMNSVELLSLLFKVSQEAITKAGGIQLWEALSDADKQRQHKEMYLKIVCEIGQDDFEKLSSEEKENVDFLIWAGCCMHKDMNAFKGGVQSMESYWEEMKIKGPIKMYNCDNAATSELAPDTSASKRADDKSKGGAIKASSLAGAIFRHKDRKRGQQDTLRFFFDHKIGFSICFPDTSNTRFQSHAEACAVIITYMDLLLKFLDYVKENKASRSLNHMEGNVKDAFECLETRHEFCVVTLYHEAISVPYMHKIRGPYQQEDNVLRLAALHKHVENHLCKIIMQPELLIGPTVSPKTGLFDGKQWDRPEAIYAVQHYAQDLPHLKPLLTQFCVGALETWRRFSAEFVQGREISKASEENIERAWMESTNDANESAFGIMRWKLRNNPSMSLPQFNARQMYKQNGTSQYQKALNPVQRQKLRAIT